MLTEQVFSYPGIGQMMLQAVQSNDYALLQGLFLIITVTVLVVNFIVDLLYGLVDPVQEFRIEVSPCQRRILTS